jgi:3-phosphoshikimate 1-carboxyvinyltransferase
MTSVKLTPAHLHGTVAVPSSKSMGHRLCICAGLSREGCIVDNIALSKDIEATNRCLAALDVSIRPAEPATEGRHAFAYSPSGMLDGSSGAAARTVDCGESGSTLRFFIPLAALTNVPITFTGHGKLVSRPEQPYYDLFDRQSLPYRTGTDGHLPLTVHGRLRPGAYELPGDVSSQFVSGLLFALPLLDGDSDLTIVPPLESASYIGLTVQSVRRFGITIDRRDDLHYHIPGRQAYHAPAARVAVEGDWSQAAFWLVAGSVGGAPEGIACAGLEGNSRQGDKAVLDILRRMGADITVTDGVYTARPACLHGTVIDASDCPDLVPVLSVAAALADGVTHIVHAGRLRLKECDRLAAMASELNKLGAAVREEPEGLLIRGCPGELAGGAVTSSWNDHRVAMSLAVAALACRAPVQLDGAESVTKSYPGFWHDYRMLGGQYQAREEA